MNAITIKKYFIKILAGGLVFIFIIIVKMSIMAQGVAINTTGAPPHASAAFEIESTTGGLLIPRMTQAQRGDINAPATGLMVFQTDETAGFYYYNGTAWVAVGAHETDPIFSAWNKDYNQLTNTPDLSNFIENESDPAVPSYVKSIASEDLSNWNTSHLHSTNNTGTVHGSTTIGDNLLRLTNPSTISFLRINDDNTVTTLADTDFRTAIGAGTVTGTVTSVSSGNGFSFTTITGSGSIILGTPSALTSLTNNSVTPTSHTHKVTTVLPSSTSAGIMIASGSKTWGGFYGGTTNPDMVHYRSNYDGYLYATRFYGDGSGLAGLPYNGTVTSVATGNGISGGTITTTGTLGLTGQPLALHNLNTNGIIARIGEGTVTALTISVGTGITVTKADGVNGNPTFAAKTYAVGDFAHGGIVFWVDATEQNGLVCAKSDQSTGVRWNAGTNKRIMAKGDGPLSGEMNTEIIIASQGYGDGDTYAARICHELQITEEGKTYSDWYLPSNEELLLMYDNKEAINNTATANGGSAFNQSYYWSCTEISTTDAWRLNFDTGIQISCIKDDNSRVRAIRAF